MDCCGHGHALTRRNWMWGTMLTSVGAMLSGGVGLRGSTAAAQTAETASAALDVLQITVMLTSLRLSKPEFRNYHEREAARLRSLLETATTPALRARLLEQAEEHERLAEELAEFEAAAATRR